MISHDELVNLIKNLTLENVKDFKQRLLDENVMRLNLSVILSGFSQQLAILGLALVGTKVTHVDISHNRFHCADVESFINHLQGSNVTYLDLGYCGISGQHLIKIARCLKNTEIAHIVLRNNRFKPEDAALFVDIQSGSKIYHINFAGNKFKGEEALPLAVSLKNSQITQLDLGENYFSTIGAYPFFQELMSTNITHLDLSANKINSIVAAKIIKGLRGSKVTHIQFSENAINDKQLSHVFKYLHETNITHIDLSENGITSPEAIKLINGLKGSKVIYVNLSTNLINQEKLGELALSFQNTNVLHVNFNDNQITGSDVAQFTANLQNTCITRVDLNDNLIGENENLDNEALENSEESLDDQSQVDFVKYLATSKVCYLSLSFNAIHGRMLSQLAKNLVGTQITHLDLSWQLIYLDDLVDFFRFLRGSKVESIDLSHNRIEGDLSQFSKYIKDTTIITIKGISSPELSEVLRHNQRRLMLPAYLSLGIDMFRNESQSVGQENDKELHFAGGILRELPVELRVQVVKHLPYMQHPRQISPEIQSYKYLSLIDKFNSKRLLNQVEQKLQVDFEDDSFSPNSEHRKRKTTGESECEAKYKISKI